MTASVFDHDDRRQLHDFLDERRSLEHLLPAVERLLTQNLSGLESHGELVGVTVLDWALVIEIIFKHSGWSIGVKLDPKLNSRTHVQSALRTSIKRLMGNEEWCV